jgi:hypothetical protein
VIVAAINTRQRSLAKAGSIESRATTTTTTTTTTTGNKVIIGMVTRADPK